MPWFKIDDGFTNSKPVLRLQRRVRSSAIGLWTLAGAWSAKELTDGFIPGYVIEELASTPAIAGHLVKCGLWEEAEEGWQFKGWDKYQPTREQIMEARDREAERKRKYRESQRRPSGTTAGRTEGHQQESEPPDPTRPHPTRTNIEEEAKASSPKVEEERPDIDKVIQAFSDMLKANDIKHKPGQAWRQAARRLIDLDGYTPDQIIYVARYATADDFWKSNILSLPKLREKFEALKIKAQAQNNPAPQRMDRSAMLRAKEADMLARFNAAQEQPFLQIED
jgi:hypothetical protein